MSLTGIRSCLFLEMGEVISRCFLSFSFNCFHWNFNNNFSTRFDQWLQFLLSCHTQYIHLISIILRQTIMRFIMSSIISYLFIYNCNFILQELSAFIGNKLESQTKFLFYSIRKIVSLYKNVPNLKIILVGHSIVN